MLREHAITYNEKLSISQVDYLVKKANRLGLANRNIIHVHEETDLEGTHVYFDVTGLSYEQRRISEDIN